MSDDGLKVPVYQEFMGPTLEVLRRAGRPMAIEDLDRLVIERMRLGPEVAAVPHDPEKADMSEVAYRLSWARTYLKKAGLITNPRTGRWAVTDEGRETTRLDAYEVASKIVSEYKKLKAVVGGADPAAVDDEDDPYEELAAARVSEEMATELLRTHAEMQAAGELLTDEQVATYLDRFRTLFGPDALARLDGDALLQRMHGRGRGESLVYWLEFKNDEEFPARFGSIGGGSALKFGIYLSAETGQWMTGTPGNQRRLSSDEALAFVKGQREQLIAAARVLAGFSNVPADVDYGELQASLLRAAPEVAPSSWGHKYFALLAPKLLEPFHGSEYQSHQLHKLLKIPGDGRYESARIFAGVASQLRISLIDLGSVLHRRNGGPHAYWRVGTTVGVGNVSEWGRMAAGGFASVGWDLVGDLSDVTPDQQGKDALRRRLLEKYPSEPPAQITRSRNQLFRFVTGAAERDIILAMAGGRVRGIGRVAGPYYFKPDDGPFPHRRPVEWLRIGDWQLPTPEGILTTFVPIRKDVNIVDAEARIVGLRPQVKVPSAPAVPVPESPRPPLAPLTGVLARINSVLHRKRQVILHGPPGTGKTYWAKKAVTELAARAWLDTDATNLTAEQHKELERQGVMQTCSFHPAYGYEDFLEGYRPTEADGAVRFALRDGIFKRLCALAEKAPARPFYLLIDEINRGDIPRIFGELLTVIERERRGESITLPLSSSSFSVPDNVYVIGTMNTADRSIALLDAALRRRFGFIELLPDVTPLAGVVIAGLPLGPWLEELNRRVVIHVGRDARHLQIGHSYLLPGGAPVRDLGRFVEILRDDILPLLEEYCYEDFQNLEKILGPKLIHREHCRVDHALFEPERHQDLIQELLSAFHNIAATRNAADAGPNATSDADDEDDVADAS
jgi:5-methylcytosine-specific restriction enzyme B